MIIFSKCSNIHQTELCFLWSVQHLLWKAQSCVSGLVPAHCRYLDSNRSCENGYGLCDDTARQRGGVSRPVFKDTGRSGAVNPLTPTRPWAEEQSPAGRRHSGLTTAQQPLYNRCTTALTAGNSLWSWTSTFTPIYVLIHKKRAGQNNRNTSSQF